MGRFKFEFQKYIVLYQKIENGEKMCAASNLLADRNIRRVIGGQLRGISNRLSDVLPDVANEGHAQFQVGISLLKIEEVRIFRVDDSCLDQDDKMLRDILERCLRDELSADEKVLRYEPFKYKVDKFGERLFKLEKKQRGVLLGKERFRIIVVVNNLENTGHEPLKICCGTMIDSYVTEFANIVNNRLK